MPDTVAYFLVLERSQHRGLKILAAMKGKTIADLIREWVSDNLTINKIEVKDGN